MSWGDGNHHDVSKNPGRHTQTKTSRGCSHNTKESKDTPMKKIGETMANIGKICGFKERYLLPKTSEDPKLSNSKNDQKKGDVVKKNRLK